MIDLPINHTPCPWEIDNNDQEFIIATDSDGTVIYVAEARDFDDALLIAAAPDLLAVCVKVLELGHSALTNKMIEKAVRKAVRK